MKSISAQLKAHLALPVTTLAKLWRVNLINGTILGFTDSDTKILFNGQTYMANAGYSASAIKTGSDMAVDELQIDGFLQTGAINAAQLEAGIFDGARVLVMLVNWADLTQGSLIQRSGVLGNVQREGIKFSAELHGLTQRLQNTIGMIDGPDCDAIFGDARCKYPVPIIPGTVDASTDRRHFDTSDIFNSSGINFVGGLVTFTSGPNAGLSMEVKAVSTAGDIELQLSFPYAITAGESFNIQPGCNKTLEMCKDYDNVVNNRSIPWLPGNDAVLAGVGTTS